MCVSNMCWSNLLHCCTSCNNIMASLSMLSMMCFIYPPMLCLPIPPLSGMLPVFQVAIVMLRVLVAAVLLLVLARPWLLLSSCSLSSLALCSLCPSVVYPCFSSFVLSVVGFVVFVLVVVVVSVLFVVCGVVVCFDLGRFVCCVDRRVCIGIRLV